MGRSYDVETLGGVMGLGKSLWLINHCQANKPYLTFRPDSSVRSSDLPPNNLTFLNGYLKTPGIKGVGTITSRGRTLSSIDCLLVDRENPLSIITAITSSPDSKRIECVGLDEVHMYSNVSGLIDTINTLGSMGIKVKIVTLETDFGGVPFPIIPYLRDHTNFNLEKRTKVCDLCHDKLALYNQVLDSDGRPDRYNLLGSIRVGDTTPSTAKKEATYWVVCPTCFQIPEGSPLHPDFKEENLLFNNKKPSELNLGEITALLAFKNRPQFTIK